jgi:hypothetical protein
LATAGSSIGSKNRRSQDTNLAPLREQVHPGLSERHNKWLASMNTIQEALKAAPEFKYPK